MGIDQEVFKGYPLPAMGEIRGASKSPSISALRAKSLLTAHWAHAVYCPTDRPKEQHPIIRHRGNKRRCYRNGGWLSRVSAHRRCTLGPLRRSGLLSVLDQP